MNLYAILHFIFWVMFGIGIILVSNNAIYNNKRKNILTKFNKNEDIGESNFDLFLDKFSFIVKQEKEYSRIIKIIQDKHNPRYYTRLSLLCAILGVTFSLYMNNLYILFPLVIVTFQVPSLILEIKLNTQLKKYDKQISFFLQRFITEYTTIGNVTNALIKVLDKLEKPLKPQIEILINELNSGIPPEKAFQSLSDRSSNKNLLIFSQLMIMHHSLGSNFVEEISKTIQNMRDESMMKEENSTELSMIRLANILLNLSIPFFYIAVKYLNPQDTLVFTNTSDGKKIILFVVCTSMFSLIMGNKMSKIKI